MHITFGDHTGDAERRVFGALAGMQVRLTDEAGNYRDAAVERCDEDADGALILIGREVDDDGHEGLPGTVRVPVLDLDEVHVF